MSIPAYQRSARTTIVVWMMLVVGATFWFAGFTVDPQTNCSESGECAPWLVPVAGGLGVLLTAAALGLLWVNPQRGCMIDPNTGELTWWQNRTRTHPGDGGSIDPAQISRILIRRQSESNDDVFLYDLEGNRQFYFDSEVVPWPYDKWAQRMAKIWPHIQVVEEG